MGWQDDEIVQEAPVAAAVPWGEQDEIVQKAPAPAQPPAHAPLGGLTQIGPGLARGASRVAITGPGQLVTAGAQALGIPGADVKNYNAAVKTLEDAVFGQSNPTQERAALAGAVGAGIAANPVGATTTLLGGLARGGALGAVGGGTTFDPSAKDPSDIGWNAVLGAGAGTMLSILPATYGALRNKISAIFNRPPTGESLKALEELMKTPEFRAVAMEAGQRTGAMPIQNLIANVASTRARTYYSNQIKQTVDILTRNTPRASWNVNKIAHDAGEAFKKLEVKEWGKASDQYAKALDDVAVLAHKSQSPPVPMNDIMEFVVSNLEDIDTNAFAAFMDPAARKFYPEFSKVFGRIIDAAKRNETPALSLEEIVQFNRVGRAMKRAVYSKQFENLSDAQKSQVRKGQEFVRALEGDTERAIQAGGVDEAGQKALERFAQGNAEYKAFWAAKREMNASALGQIFGQGPIRDPEAAIHALFRASPAQQAIAMRAMNDLDPRLLPDIKAWKMQDVLQSSMDLTNPASLTELEPNRVIKALTQDGDVAGKPFWTPSELQNIRSGVATLRLIGDRLTATNRGVDPKSLGVALATKSRAFSVGPLWKILGAPKWERMLLDPKSLLNLRIVANTMDRPTAATARALGQLAAMVNGTPETGEDTPWTGKVKSSGRGR